ncbi:unnamed protein product [Urochloa decumbens]|uniref:Exocyst subunit Exo70 family protein n=1 Tax=Urochloa decumbens TaxID=240449 RepID=A0ABC9B5V4_9POAL
MAAYAFGTAGGSTTSGTYSTTYKSSGGSVVSSEPDLASRLSRIHLSSWLEDDEEKVKKIEPTKHLVKEFFHGDGDTGALERWLSEVGVGWVLCLSDDSYVGASSLLRAQPHHNNLTDRWIRALTLLEGRFVGGEQDVPGPAKQARFVKAAVLKMLPFVDALLAATGPLDAGTDTADASNGAQALSAEKLQALLDVRDAVSSTSKGIRLYFRDYSVETETRQSSDEVISLLSAKEQRLDEAVWSTMEEVRTSIPKDDDDDSEWGIQTRQGSPGICKVTRSLVTYIKSLGDDYWRLDHIVRRAAELGNYYFPERNKTDPLTTLTMEMVYSLQLKLAKRSESFADQSLRLIFLINNIHFIWQQLHPLFPKEIHMALLTPKIEGHIRKYLQVSWEPVLSCLHNHTPNYCFITNSALPKFDSEFQKTYTAQKLRKVPDPELRTRLRKAIVEKVVSGLTKYLEDNNITSPGITPQEREEMLLELFEG